MTLHWVDSFERLRPDLWNGLKIRAPGVPGLRVRAGRRCIRLDRRGTPLLWARVDGDWWGYSLLRPVREASPGVLPPIPFESVREHESQDRAWARHYARRLSESDASPLYPAEWRLGYRFGSLQHRELAPPVIEETVAQRRHGYVRWDFGEVLYPITLRDFSAPDSGRVKAWRKLASAGALPPVLLFWVSGLDAHVVLDGHDRLLAAHLEQAPIGALELVALGERSVKSTHVQALVVDGVSKALDGAERERTRATEDRLARRRHVYDVESANSVLLDAFTPDRSAAPTRAWPLLGGAQEWRTEVREELARQRVSESYLLEEPI